MSVELLGIAVIAVAVAVGGAIAWFINGAVDRDRRRDMSAAGRRLPDREAQDNYWPYCDPTWRPPAPPHADVSRELAEMREQDSTPW